MHEKIKVITILRKESKRFPNKNIALFKGKPLYMHTVDYAKTLPYPYYVIHNYDKLDLPKWVNEIKFEGEFSDENYLPKIIKKYKLDADIYILLQATSPIREYWNDITFYISRFCKIKKIKVGVGVFLLEDKYYYCCGKRLFDYKKRSYNGCLKYTLVNETGSFFIFRKSQLKKKHILIASIKDTMFIHDKNNIDIDYKEDLDKLNKGCKCKQK